MREGLGVCPRAVGRSACESMNSHTPSDATMMKRSPSASGSLAGAAPRSNRLISGSGMTPKRLHSPSPMERDIAKPTRPSAHTRAGEAPLAPETTPPAPTMRSYSSGESGLQSTERSRARIAPSRT